MKVKTFNQFSNMTVGVEFFFILYRQFIDNPQKRQLNCILAGI